MKKILIFTVIALLFSINGKSLNAKIDSLVKVLKTAAEDTSKVNTLNNLSQQLIISGNYEKAKLNAVEALLLSQKIKFRKGESSSYNSIGNIYWRQGNFAEALKNYFLSLKILEKIGDKDKIASVYTNIGIIYGEQENYPEALKMFFASLKIKQKDKDTLNQEYAHTINDIGETFRLQGNFPLALKYFSASLKILKEIGNKDGIAISYNNIGAIYKELGNYPLALKNYFASLKINEELGDKIRIARCYNNIGVVYDNQGNYSEALKNYFSSLKIKEEIGNKRGIAATYMNIGNVYRDQVNYSEALKYVLLSLSIAKEVGDKSTIGRASGIIGLLYKDQGNYPEALKNYSAALQIFEELGQKQDIAGCYGNLGNVNVKLKRFAEAKQQYDKAIIIFKEIGMNLGIRDIYLGMAELDSATGNWKAAYDHHKLFMLYSDSLINEENTKKTVRIQMQYKFDKIQDSTFAEQTKKDVVAMQELKQQQHIRNFTFAGLAGVLLFLFVVMRQRNRVKKEKKRSDELLLNILPAEVAEELKLNGHSSAKTYSMVTVMFTDFADFTKVSAKVSAELLVAEIDYCFSAFDNIVQKYGLEKIKTVGDAYICAGGMPKLNFTHSEDMINAAIEIRNFMAGRKKEKETKREIPFDLRIGINTGPVVAGIVGIKKFAYDIWGDTVNIAARMESSGEIGKINVSGTTYDLVKDKFTFIHRGKIEAKNKGMVDMYFVEK